MKKRIAIALLLTIVLTAAHPAPDESAWTTYAIRWYAQCLDRQKPDTFYCERDAIRAVAEARQRLQAEAGNIVPLDDQRAYGLGMGTRGAAMCGGERIQGCPEPVAR